MKKVFSKENQPKVIAETLRKLRGRDKREMSFRMKKYKESIKEPKTPLSRRISRQKLLNDDKK
jgi:hypothetical protein